MRNLIIFITFFFLLGGVNQSFSNWYGNHAVFYNNPGVTQIGPSTWHRGTFCDQDGQGTPGAAVALNNNTTTLTPHGVSPMVLPASGTMRCLYWDSEPPVVGYILSGGTNLNDTWTNENVTSTITCSDTGGSLCDSSSYQYRRSSTSFACDSGGTWTNGSSYLHSTPNNTNLIEYICFRARDIAGNGYVYSTVATIKIDKILPDPTDITNSINTDLLATHSYPYSFSIGVNGGAPITTIQGFRERHNNETIDLAYICMGSPCTVTWDISNVDNFRLANGGRHYTFRVTNICDQAGNCWSGTQNYNHNVYANTTAMTGGSSSKNVTTNQLISPANIADGTIKNLTINLLDTYGNQIVTATGIGRTVNFNWNVTNTMFLDQHSRSGQGSVYVTNSNESTFSNTRLPGGPTSLNGQTSANGDYTYSFKVYTPTSNQNLSYGPVSDTSAQFIINDITFDVNGILGPVSAESLNSWSAITAQFNPLYYSQIAGTGITLNGFVEGARQDSLISIMKNGSSTTTNERLQLSYGGTDSGSFTMYAGTNIGNASSIGGTLINSRANIVSNLTFTSNNNNLYTYLLQNPGAVGNISNINLATHINYNIAAPNGVLTINPIYNSDIFGKSSYHGTNDLGGTNQSSLKVLGQVSTSSSGSILNDQFPSDVRVVGSSDKFILKTQIIKNGWEFVKNLVGNTTDNSNLINIDSPNTGTHLNDVIYFGATSGAGGNIYNLGNTGGSIGINTNKTILVIGGNLYIRSNLYYTGDGMLGIVVLKDSDGNGGNIYVDPSVTNIVGTLFAEKSILGYNLGIELDGSTDVVTLRNQLHIFGSLFSENTIGGSREATPRCPYYITSLCNRELAQKYDLNYLRRYYLITDIISTLIPQSKKPANNGMVIGGGSYDLNGVLIGGNPSYARNITTTTDTYAGNSVVIEYNPNIQLSPPPLFTR